MGNAVISEQYLEDIADAIISKGGSDVPLKPSEMAQAIQSIPSGRNWRGWVPPSDWPDIPQILEDVKAGSGYLYACAYLLDPSMKSVYLTGASKYVLSDGDEITSSNVSHIWQDVGYHWCVSLSNTKLFSSNNSDKNGLLGPGNESKVLLVYGDGEAQIEAVYWNQLVSGSGTGSKSIRCILVDFHYNNNAAWPYRDLKSLEYIKGRLFFSSSSPSMREGSFFAGSSALKTVDIDFDRTDFSMYSENINAFADCYALESINSFAFGSGGTSYYGLFSNCYALREVHNPIDTSKATSCYRMFYNCCNLVEVPDTLDLGRCTSVSGMFDNCFNLKSIPKNVTLNISISFAQSSVISDKNSVATFDASGSVTGGFVGNLRSFDGTNYVQSCPNSGQTITFHSNVKSLFTTDEQVAIAECLTSKNWGLVW